MFWHNFFAYLLVTFLESNLSEDLSLDMFLLYILCTVKYFKQHIFASNDALKCTICTHLSAMPTLNFLLHLVSVTATSNIRLSCSGAVHTGLSISFKMQQYCI